MSRHNGSTRDTGSYAVSALLLVAAGALVGAAAALVLAPASGQDTRDFIRRKGRALADDVAARGKQVWNEHGERVVDAVRQGYAEAAGAMAERVNSAIDDGARM